MSNNNINDILNELKDKFNEFGKSNRDAYHNFMSYADDIEDIAYTIADKLNSIADDIEDINYNFFYRPYEYNSERENRYNQKTSEENKSSESNNSQTAKTEESNKENKTEKKNIIKIDLEKLKSKVNIISEKCRQKIKEIEEISEDFDYASKKNYKDVCVDLINTLNKDFDVNNIQKRCNDFIDNFNKLIGYINNLYKSALYRKENRSSLSFMLEEEDDDIDLIENIKIDDIRKI